MRTLRVLFALLLTALGAQARPLTAEDAEAFLDGLMPQMLARSDVAGAVVTIVKDGQLLLAKGYGYADVAAKLPVRADETRFRVASVTKVFTATAVMQLVDDGKLDLDRDVRAYLDFEIPRAFPGPITLRRLLTHTAGFEDQYKEPPIIAGERSLRRMVATAIPAQIYAPGTVTAYSNWGYDLAGYIIERVSGMPYGDFVRRRILLPLGMEHSTVGPPDPKRGSPGLARGYFRASDPAEDYETYLGGASAGLTTTGADMAKFMIAHLQLGAPILSQKSAQLMRTPQFRTHPDVPGMALGFLDTSRLGHRMIGHAGSLLHYQSDLQLFVDDGVGLFLSYNSAGNGGSLRRPLLQAFMNRYFSGGGNAVRGGQTGVSVPHEVAGSYFLSRRQQTSIGKLFSVVDQYRIVASADGTIEVLSIRGLNGRPLRWRQIGPLLFVTEDGGNRLAFLRDAHGRIAKAAFLGGHELLRARWFESVTFATAMIVVCGAMLLITLAWPRRLHFRLRLVCLALLGMLGAAAVVFQRGQTDVNAVYGSLDPWIRAIQLLGAIALAGTALVSYTSFRAWRMGEGSRWARVHVTIVALACVAICALAFQWNLFVLDLTY